MYILKQLSYFTIGTFFCPYLLLFLPLCIIFHILSNYFLLKKFYLKKIDSFYLSNKVVLYYLTTVFFNAFLIILYLNYAENKCGPFKRIAITEFLSDAEWLEVPYKLVSGFMFIYPLLGFALSKVVTIR